MTDKCFVAIILIVAYRIQMKYPTMCMFMIIGTLLLQEALLIAISLVLIKTGIVWNLLACNSMLFDHVVMWTFSVYIKAELSELKHNQVEFKA